MMLFPPYFIYEKSFAMSTTSSTLQDVEAWCLSAPIHVLQACLTSSRSATYPSSKYFSLENICRLSSVTSKYSGVIAFWFLRKSVMAFLRLSGSSIQWKLNSIVLSFADRMAKTNDWTNRLLKFDWILLSSTPQRIIMCYHSFTVFVITLIGIPIPRLPFSWQSRFSPHPLCSIPTFFRFFLFERLRIWNIER